MYITFKTYLLIFLSRFVAFIYFGNIVNGVKRKESHILR